MAPSAARRVVGRTAVAVVARSRALLRILLCYESAPLLWCYASCTAGFHLALLCRIDGEENEARASICTTIAQLCAKSAGAKLLAYCKTLANQALSLKLGQKRLPAQLIGRLPPSELGFVGAGARACDSTDAQLTEATDTSAPCDH